VRGSRDDLVNRAFDPAGPDRLWCMDITEHPTGTGKVYLAVVLDAWSRRVVGWSIGRFGFHGEVGVMVASSSQLGRPA
jgi:putative transposase